MLSRRSLVGVIAFSPVALAACSFPAARGSRRVTSDPGEHAERLSKQELLAEMSAAIAGAPTARVTSERMRTDGGLYWWRTSGTVRYPADGMPRAYVTVELDWTDPFDVLTAGPDLFILEDGQWRSVTLHFPDAAYAPDLGSEITSAMYLLGPAEAVRSASFTRAAASPLPGTVLWTADLPAADWLATQPESTQDHHRDVLTNVNVQLVVDEEALPVRRIDFGQPNSAELTIETTWNDWGTPLDPIETASPSGST